MKKLLFGLIAIVLFANLSFGQSKEVFNEFEIIKTESITFENDLVKRFLKNSDFNFNNKDVNFTKNVELLTLKNNFQTLKFKIENIDFNSIYAIYNKEKNDFMWYFINNTADKIEVFSSNREILSSYSNIKNYVSVNNIESRSVFSACMDAVERDYTDSLLGWVHWHTSPMPALVAAASCQGCARGWWSCPPAYTATLQR